MTPGDVLKGVKIGYFSFYVFVNFSGIFYDKKMFDIILESGGPIEHIKKA